MKLGGLGGLWEKALGFGGLAVLAAAYIPSRVFLSNPGKFPHPERVLALVALYLALGASFQIAAHGLGAKRGPAALGAATLILLLSSGANLSARLGPLEILSVVLVVSGLATWLLHRVVPDLWRIGIGTVAVLLVSGSIASIIAPKDQIPSRVLEADVVSRETPKILSSKPDIFVVILDGFPGDIALREVFGVVPDWGEADSVQRPRSAWSSYPVSLASVASMLEMTYPVGDGSILGSEVKEHLAQTISGENLLVSELQRHGYETVLVESGWSRSFCGASIDVCVESAFLDEGTFEILRQSILGPLLVRSKGSGLTIGAFHAASWLETNLKRLSDDDKPTFVLSTILLPHPPLFVDAECNFVYDALHGWREEKRVEALLEQIRCAGIIEGKLLDVVSDDDILIVVADHGSESRRQLSMYDLSWDVSDRIERLNVHLTAQLPDDCHLVDPTVLPNLMHMVLWCLAASEEIHPQPLEPRMFVANRIAEPKVLEIEEVSQEVESGLLFRLPD